MMGAYEVCGLTWDCVDLANKTIKVEKIILYKERKLIFGTPKTKSSNRPISIGDTLVNILATILLEGGAVPKDIQETLGHSKIATTMDTYSHVTLKIKNAAVNILENILAT